MLFRSGLDTATDRSIWEFAKQNGFTIVSQDADFAELASLFGPPPKVIWLRCGNQRTEAIELLFRANAPALIVFEQDVNASCWEIY